MSNNYATREEVLTPVGGGLLVSLRMSFPSVLNSRLGPSPTALPITLQLIPPCGVEPMHSFGMLRCGVRPVPDVPSLAPSL